MSDQVNWRNLAIAYQDKLKSVSPNQVLSYDALMPTERQAIVKAIKYVCECYAKWHAVTGPDIPEPDAVICPYCKQPAVWCENSVIYNGRNYGKSYMCYYCRPCDAYVGCHNNSRRPLGTMANKETREWRKKAHAAIDPIWQRKMMTRTKLYELKKHFGHEVHIGESDAAQCRAIIQFGEGYLL